MLDSGLNGFIPFNMDSLSPQRVKDATTVGKGQSRVDDGLLV